MKDLSHGKYHELAVVRTKEGYKIAQVKRGKMSEGRYLDVTVEQYANMLPKRHLEDAMQAMTEIRQSQIHSLI